MAHQVIQDARLYLAGYNLSGDVNACALDYSADMVDDSAIVDTSHSRLGGLKVVTMQLDGYFEGTDIDAALFNRIGVANEVVSIIPAGQAIDGGRAFTFKSNLAEYSPGAQLGDIFAFTVTAEATERLVRGTLMINATATASGNGTGQQLGAVSASQTLYAALHVLSASAADTLDVIVQSDDASGFATPINRITFTQATAIGAQWQTLTGPITDNWWRINYTIGGTAPSFTFAVILGIQ